MQMGSGVTKRIRGRSPGSTTLGPEVTRGIFLERGEGKVLSARGSVMSFKAFAETTNGAFSLMERELPVSIRRPQPHRHMGPEGFYVLEGSIEFIAGDPSRVGGPGFWALVPGGVGHTFGNVGEAPARLSSSTPQPPIHILWNLKLCGTEPPLQRPRKSVR